MAKQFIVFICLCLLTSSICVAEQPTLDPFSSVAATVMLNGNEKKIYLADYQSAIYEKIRSTYYHGKPPAGEEDKLKDQIWDEIINNTLLWLVYESEENKTLDTNSITNELAEYDKKYAKDERWVTVKKRVLGMLERGLTRGKIALLLKTRFDDAVNISPQEAKNYYLKNPQLFTEPERIRALIILLSVDPSSSSSIWQLAIEQASKIRAEINNIEDFKDSARQYSTDITAEQGGDMGLLHQGQLGGEAKVAIEKLVTGEISKPVVLLEGVALFMVTERQGATHHTFDEVVKRATELARRDKRQQGWKELLAGLKAEASITVDKAVFSTITD